MGVIASAGETVASGVLAAAGDSWADNLNGKITSPQAQAIVRICRIVGLFIFF